MLKIRDIFLRRLAWVFLALFIVMGTSLYVWIKDIYIENIKQNLLHSVDIVAASKKDLKDIDKYVRNIKEYSGIRITIINDEGIVIAESDTNKDDMNNHKLRSEIVDAKQRDYGYAIRHSQTLNKELLYVAKKVKLGDVSCFIRMAKDTDEIIASFLTVSLKTAMLFILFALFAYRMISGVGTGVQRETQKILDFLDHMGDKEKDKSIQSNYSSEFKKITELLTQTSQKLHKRRKQKSKYTARLKLANHQKDDIISAISHEFKNPITVINGYAQTLIEDKNIHPDIADKFLSKIYANTNKLTHMIDRLRLFIRLDEHKQKSTFADTDIYKLIENSIETLLINYPGRTIKSEIISRPILQANTTLLEIAIINLIENALKYSKDETVTVTLDAKSMKVIDKGIGIAQKEINKITEKFYRVQNNSWDNSMGIGLSLVSNIVAMHNFSLHIESQEGLGSTFEIRFLS